MCHVGIAFLANKLFKFVILGKQITQNQKKKKTKNIAVESVRPGLVDCDSNPIIQPFLIKIAMPRPESVLLKFAMPRPESIFLIMINK